MANSTPAGIIIEYDNAALSLVVITQHVITINDFDITQIMEDVRPLGQAWGKFLPIGVAETQPIVISGLYDDTAATGPDALFGGRLPETPATPTRTFKITWVGTKTTAVETFLAGYKRSPDKSGLTKYTTELRTTGAVTET